MAVGQRAVVELRQSVERMGGQFRAAGDFELGEHVAQMEIDGPGSDVQLRCDVAVREPLSHEPGHLQFLWGEVHDGAFRPDLIGSVVALHDGGAYTMVFYFTSEAAAREGERKELPLELRAAMDEMSELTVGEPEFFDLLQPVMRSASQTT